VQEARMAYASKAANAELGVPTGHQLAPMLDDAQREIAIEIARQEAIARAKAEAAAEAAAFEAEQEAAAKAAHRRAAAEAAARAPPTKQPARSTAPRVAAEEPEKSMRKRIPPSAAIVGETDESMRARAEVEARKSHKAKNKGQKDTGASNLMPMFSQALAEQETLFSLSDRKKAAMRVENRKSTPKGAADKNINIDESPAALQHAEGELSFAQFVQLLGPTFAVNKKPTPAQRRAQQLLEQLQRR